MPDFKPIEKDNTYLITGGTGFLGKELIARLYDQCNLVVFARNEGKLIELQSQYPNIRILTGTLDNKFEVTQACKGVQGVFHLGAFKHVGIAEYQSYECVSSNVIGTLNVLEESLGMDFVLGISTDKAAQVKGVYGATKLIMEHLFQQFEKVNPHTNYRIVRYGNVIGSTGSVITKWIPLLKEGKEVTITDPEATRFYWTVNQAIDLIFACLENSTDCTPYCPAMKAIKMDNLLLACWLKYGTGDLKAKTIGLQEGENMHERIIEGGKYSNEVELYTTQEIKDLI